MTFEEYLDELNPVIHKTIYEFKPLLKMDAEDMYQEACLLLFDLIEKIDNTKKYYSYFKAALSNKFRQIRVLEHQQLLHLTESNVHINDNGEELDIFELYSDSELDLTITDMWLENRIQYIKEYKRKYREEHKEEIKEYNKKYYEEHREKIQKYSQEYYQTHKEELNEYHKKYKEEHKEVIKEINKRYRDTHKDVIKRNKMKWEKTSEKAKEGRARRRKRYIESHKEEIKEYRRKYYQEHKEEINAKKRERRRLKKIKEKEEQVN